MVFGWPRSAGKVDLSSVNRRFVSTVLTLELEAVKRRYVPERTSSDYQDVLAYGPG